MLNSVSSKLNSIPEANLAFKQRDMHFYPRIKTNSIPKSWEINPSYITDKDIKGEDGSVIYLAGMYVNPLAINTLPYKLLFIDGDDGRQVESALKFPTDGYTKHKIILAKGCPQSLIKKFNTMFYLDSYKILCREFGIKRFPSVVSQRGLRLVVEELILNPHDIGRQENNYDTISPAQSA
jgi:hypothetical protein